MFYKALLLTAALALPALTIPAAAQPAATPDYAAFCTAEASFGVRFGVAAPDGRASTTNSVMVPLDPGFAPFPDAEASVSHWTRNVHMVMAEARLGDPAAVAALVAEIRRAYEARGWTVRPGMGEDSLAIYSVAPGPDDEPNSGLKLTLSPFRGMLMLGCTDLARQRSAMAEAMDGPPAGTSRPLPPALPAIPTLTLAQCEDPAGIAALTGRPEELLEPIMGYGSNLVRYQSQLAAWKADRIVRAGRWTRRQAAEFAGSLLRDPAIGESLQRGSAMMTELIGLVTEQPATPRQACAQLLRLDALMRRVVAHVRAQSQLIEAAYDAEARRLGVTLN